MKLEEVRIGNYVNPGGEIECLELADFADSFENGKGWFDNLFKPIPLTEEWLLKLGFEQKGDKVYYYDRFKLYFVNKYEFWYLNDKRTNTYITKVEFVHELQNAIFVLNGEELTIK